MRIAAIRNRPRTVSTGTRFGWFHIKAVFFLGLIGFLLFWALWGDTLEERVYGPPSMGFRNAVSIGAEIGTSPSNGRPPDVVVREVLPGSPAARAGLKAGDRIVGLDGRLISSLEMAQGIIGAKSGDTLLKLTIDRNGRNREIYVRFNEPLPKNQVLTKKAMENRSFPAFKRFLVIVVFLKLTALLFYFLYKHSVNRTAIVLSFGAAVMMMGGVLESYSLVDAFFAIKFNTISLLLGMGVISVVLDESGFFDHVAFRISRYAGNSTLRLMVFLSLITYVFSLFTNNLTTILVMVPITLNLAAVFRFDPRPFIIGEIISSNLGGASTMVGDFPNMLISAETNIGFFEFIIFMMPICLILLGILLMCLWFRIGEFPVFDAPEGSRVRIRTPELNPEERRALRRAVFVLCHVIFLFVVSEKISLRPAAVALCGGLSLFLFSGIDRRKILNHVGFNDIFYFIGLFVVVGGLETSGLLLYISNGLTFLSLGKPWLLCLILMWSVAMITAFLNAGPTTALFFPVVSSFTIMLPNHAMWWALSLGVLAGSSATIFGATAGPVAAGLVEQFSLRYSFDLPGGNTITFQQSARIGVPVMFLFLAASSVYVMYLCRYP